MRMLNERGIGIGVRVYVHVWVCVHTFPMSSRVERCSGGEEMTTEEGSDTYQSTSPYVTSSSLDVPQERRRADVASDTNLEGMQPTSPVSHRRTFPESLKQYVVTEERRLSEGLLSFIAAIPIFLMGFTVAFPSNAILDLRGEATELPESYLLPTFLISTFAALALLGAVFSGPIGGWIADCWGRKCSLMFCGVPYIIGYLLLSYAHYASTATAFKAILLTGRFISGLGVGWSSAVVPVYIGEISSAKLRGIFGAMSQTMLTSGIVFNYAIGSINGFRYYYISLVAVGIVALFEVLMVWLPETPRWLLSRGYVKRAEKVMQWLRGKRIGTKKELDEIKSAIAAKKREGKKAWREFSKRSVLIPLTYIFIVFFFHQAGGISAVAAFAATIFSDAGVSIPRVTSIYAVGLASLVGNFTAFFLVDLVGRTFLLTVSGTGMFLGSTMLGTHFFITRSSLCSDFTNSTIVDSMETEPCNTHFGPLATVSLILYRFSFSIGFGPIPWILVSEFLPLPVRGFASGFAMLLNWTISTIVTGFYLEYAAVVQQWFAMWTFALSNLVATLFVIVFLPETKGKSLEELERKFMKQPDIVETDI